jgi:hypothetical protein
MQNTAKQPSWSNEVSAFIRMIQLKSLRERTQDAYLSWVLRVAKHHGVACPSLLGEAEVLAFLHHVQQTRGYEGSTLNQMVCALRIFYRDHLGKEDWRCWKLIRIKRTPPLPTVLTREEAFARFCQSWSLQGDPVADLSLRPANGRSLSR